MKTIFINVILNLFQGLNIKETGCRNKFGTTKRVSKGFTLIELLVVITIIGILSSFLFANFVGVRQRARDGVRKSDLRQIQSALELYRADKGVYPSSLPPCGSSLQDTSTPPVVYMKKLSCDPSSGLTYVYNSPSGNATYVLIACLENGNDSQKDASVDSSCSSTTNISYTLQNP
jgi:general secretion pathway protein G